ncbi:MAG TPA: MBL fold metallo-hydrolase, partial [Candidatus Methylomirabilis sp.]|nr:MBL fold metallo-hydrolase [Candidatus Methylomirabilis sp.]
MSTRTGRELIQQINGLAVPTGTLAVWGLGQSGFVIKGGETIIYIDPYLSGQVGEGGRTASGRLPRQFPPPLSPGEATNAQWVFCTHDHHDHTDPETLGTLARVSPRARFVGPSHSREILRSLAITDESILLPPVDTPQTFGPLTFTVIPAAHYGLER